MEQRIGTLLASAVLLLCAPGDGLAAAAKLVDPLAGTTVEIGATQTFSVPVRFEDGVKPRTLGVSVLQVSVEKRSRPELTSRFRPSVAAGGGEIGSLTVTLTPGSPLAPATYDVLLEIARRSKAQTLTLQLIVPAATMRPLPQVRVRLTGGWPFADVMTRAELVLSESGGKSSLSGLSLASLDVRKKDGTASGGRLVAEATPLPTVAAGGMRTIPLESAGGFDLGTTTGTFSIDATQLKDPVEVTFEVVRRTNPLWIVFWALLGLLFGRGMLAGLGHYIERSDAVDGLYGLIERINRELAQPTDAELRTALKGIRLRLSDATKDKELKLADLGKVATDEAAAIDTALTDYDARVAKATEQLGQLRRLYEDPRPMPAFARDGRATLAAEIASISGELADGRADAALKALESLEMRLARTLQEGFAKWAETEGQALDAIAAITLPPADLGARDAIVQAAREALDAGVGKSAPAAAEMLNLSVEAAAKLRAVGGWTVRLEGIGVDVVNILRSADKGDTPEVGELAAAIEELAEQRRSAPAAEGLTPELAAAAVRVARALLPAILSITDDPAAEEVSEVFEKSGASAAALRAREKRQIHFGARSIKRLAPQERLVAPREAAEPDVAVRPALYEYFALRRGAREPVEVRRRRLRRTTTVVRALRFVVIVVTILALSYFLFAENWVGTRSDIAQVLFWSWGLEIAAETVTREAAGFAPATARPA